jgi:hypothetical protein
MGSGNFVGQKVNDHAAVLFLKNAIDVLRHDVFLKLAWVPHVENLTGPYIEAKVHPLILVAQMEGVRLSFQSGSCVFETKHKCRVLCGFNALVT